MLLVTKIDNEQLLELQNKFEDRISLLPVNSSDLNQIVKTLEQIKAHLLQYELVCINMEPNILTCLDKLHITYYVLSSEKSDNLSDKIIELEDNSYIKTLSKYFPWLKTEEILPQNTQLDEEQLTLKKLSESDVTITEANVRQTKVIETKAKVAMYLQVDLHIKRLYKLLDTINLLEDELLERVANDLHSTDTGSLIQVSKCLNDTLTSINTLIMSIVNNEKIQNFFVIDNSSNVNIETGTMDVESRDKLRKAVEIITQNLDLFKQGKIDNLIDPNSVIEVKADDSKT